MAIKLFKDNKIQDLSSPGMLALATILDKTYPIGTYYETSSIEFDPNEEFIGQWVEDSKGLVLIAADHDGDNMLDKMGLLSVNVGELVGEKEHKLTVEQIPEHQHKITLARYGTDTASGVIWESGNTTGKYKYSGDMIEPVGGNEAHNNTQPSLGVRRWHRIS